MLAWFRKPHPATPPLVDYWLQVRVELTAPIRLDGGLTVVGYYRLFGVRSTAEALHALVGEAVDDGVITWDELEVREVDVHKLSRKIAKPLRSPRCAGIWHQSGRIYFPADEDAPESAPELSRF